MSAPTISHPTNRPNYTEVQANGIIYAFSYSTCIGAHRNGVTITRENIWGPTTGKHLNHWDGGDKAARLSADDFQAALILLEDGERT